ncbi:hypothetical protein [Brevundimonas pondensis]|uniref:Uncharacterized protein n=1 Tax=Brevundimonas pondensis TaxID=2774189 RepID=A0ABX7SIF6_9CAUL|nr:hypothetical protein [Brevundimonas pondensis]QTC87477.1 hypothetical protein IFE19_15510 [Brevundimonas pondensis]
MTRPALSEDQVIEAFLLEDATDSRTLSLYLERYPDHAEALLDLAHDIAFTEVSRHALPSSDEDDLIAMGWATIQSAERTAVTAADWTGAMMGKVQAAVGAPMPVVMNLRDRRFKRDSLPPHLLDVLSQCLERTKEAVAEYLEQPAGLAKAAAYKASQAPQVAAEKLDYADFLRDLGLPEEERRRLLDGPA